MRTASEIMAGMIIQGNVAPLKAEIEMLRGALEQIASLRPLWHGGVGPTPRSQLEGLIQQMQDEARAALQRLDTTRADPLEHSNTPLNYGHINGV